MMITQIKKFLNQPYPDADDLKSIFRDSLLTGVIVFLVLVLFMPFGLENAKADAAYYAAIFGLVTAITSIAVQLFFKYVLRVERDVPTWTFWKWMLSSLFLLINIAVANHFTAGYLYGFENGDFLTMLYSTFIVGIFPIMIFGSVILIKNIKANQRIAGALNYKPIDVDDLKTIDVRASANVQLPIKNSSKTFEVNPTKILFLQSMQNYVLINYLDDEGEIKKETHRNTITALEKLLTGYGIKRTHRSYLVNPKMIDDVTGNAQGLKLAIRNTDFIVPVSRKYIPDFKSN